MSAFIVHEDLYPIYVDPDQEIVMEGGSYKGRDVAFWVDIMIDCHPAWFRRSGRLHWRPWKRWHCEVHARVSTFPRSSGRTESHWYHYYQHDFYISSLRRAFMKSLDVSDNLWDYLQANESERPDSQPWERHSHPDQ